MDEPGDSQGGFFASLGRLPKTALAILQNRFELFLVEWQEERWRLIQVFLLGGLALLLVGLALLVATVTVVELCLRENRLGWLGGLTLLYVAAAILVLWRLRARLKNWAPFSATLAELKKDKACLDKKN